ncbi:hypothetical protein [Entomohabitans teleogrylli]|uniref:hypothetical protein n=1 Tax=Entomohabitans teleogrylli TaxID=1384589 RepID=UPI00073D67FC|nr:hypothetical protein [Entomohabitans teleogrylli]
MKRTLVYGVLVSILTLLSGCASRAPQHSSAMEKSALGTAWGDEVYSPVKSVEAQRKYSEPSDVTIIRYSADSYRHQDYVYSMRKGDIEFAVRDASFRSMPIFRQRDNYSGSVQYVIKGTPGQRYQLYFRNFSSWKNYEVVATVDGLDVLNGKPGSVNNNGYILNAGESLAIKGFRTSKQAEASFEFSAVGDSYVANSQHGDVNNVGTIGFAVFELRGKTLPPCEGQAFPADNSGYAQPPCQR